MNIEAILKEREELQKQQEDPGRGKMYPYIVSQESLEKMIMHRSPPREENKISTVQSSMSIDTKESVLKNQKIIDENIERKIIATKKHHSFDDVITTAMSQPTSVITSVRQRSTDKTRLKSFQRQKSVDETMHNDDVIVTDVSGLETTTNNSLRTADKNNNSTDRQQRQTTEHSIEFFLDDTHANRSKGKILKSTSQQDAITTGYDRGHYASIPVPPPKSKSLDLVEDGRSKYPYSYPSPYPKYSSLSFEAEEQSARYINALHISPPAPHLYGHSSFPNSPCGSPIDTSLRHSPAPSGSAPMRRLQQQPDRPDTSIVFNQIPILYSNARARGSDQFVKSRSYDQQIQRQHKFSKKAYSLATAPYDVHEKNLRRILSEDNVPDNLVINKSGIGKYQHMRRAASYDLINRMSSSNGNSPTRPTNDSSYLRQQAVVKSTKIMFPEHDNVTECNSIFTQPIDDERAHALKINKIMERSFNVISDSSQHSLKQSKTRSFEERDKSNDRSFTNLQDLKNNLFHAKNILQNTHSLDEPDKTNKKNETKQNKLLVHQSSNDKNYTIGPYKYNAEIDDEIAVCVSGLLTLPGSNEKKYPISVGELRRRISPPEFLNKVDMISYVRLAKTSARELLEKHAIRPKHHSRKSKHSVISKMCEAECTELANGMKMLSDTYFPREWLANQALQSLEDEDENLIRRQQKLMDMHQRYEIARGVLKDISSLLESKKPDEQMQNYNLATHSFGALNLNNNIELLMSFIQTQTDVINQKLVNTEFASRDDNSMETESGISSKSSSIDDPQM